MKSAAGLTALIIKVRVFTASGARASPITAIGNVHTSAQVDSKAAISTFTDIAEIATSVGTTTSSTIVTMPPNESNTCVRSDVWTLAQSVPDAAWSLGPRAKGVAESGGFGARQLQSAESSGIVCSESEPIRSRVLSRQFIDRTASLGGQRWIHRVRAVPEWLPAESHLSD